MFKNLKLGDRIAAGYFSVVFLMILFAVVVSVSIVKVVNESDMVAKEFNPEIFILGESYDDLSRFIYCGNYYYISEDDEYYNEAAQLTVSLKGHLKDIRELLKNSPNLNLMRENVENFEKDFDKIGKLLNSLNETVNEKKRLHKYVFEDAGVSAVKLADELKNKFLTETKERTLACDVQTAVVFMQQNYLIAKNNYEKSQEVLDYGKQAQQNLEKFDALNISADAKQTVEKIKKTLDDYISGMNLLIVERSKSEIAVKNFSESQKVLDDLNEIYYADSDIGVENAELVSKSLRIAILTLIGGLTLTVIFAFVSAGFVVKATAGKISGAITGLSEISGKLSTASSEISNEAQTSADGAGKQASNLEEISASLNEIASMTKQTADNAKNVETFVKSSVNKTNASKEAMERLQAAVVEIKKSSDETAKILKDIDDIAFQTNLLALNAAVESARAGEAGKGFSVVAEEVRNLARRSAESAKKTAQLIEGSQKSSVRGVDLTKETAEIIEEITQESSKIVIIVTEITDAAQEQSKSVSQVSAAVEDLDKITQINAASSQELSATSHDLSSQAHAMNGLVDDLVKVVEGKNAKIKENRNAKFISYRGN